MKKLYVFILLLLCYGLSASAKIFLVSVGVADYPGTVNDLKVSANDAKTISGIFSNSKTATISTLTNSRATKSALLLVLQNTFVNANSDDTVILYFSGHGTPGGICCYDGVLQYNKIYAEFRKCKARKKMIFVDACFAGKMRSGKRTDTSSRHTSQNVLFFLSSRTNEKSQETKFQNSLFTIFLERGLRGGADTNRDKTVTARELYDFVHSGVVSASNNTQHPVMWGKFDDNMTIIKWK